MIKVAYFPMSQDDPASFYRMAGVLNYIDHPELSFFDITQEKTYNWSTLKGATHFILQRPHTESHIALISLAKDMDIRIISDWDDDLFNVPVHRNATINHDDVRKNMKRCLALSDETWVTTPELKKIYKPYCKNIYIIPNCLNDYVHAVDKRMPFTQRKLITYRGGASHCDDVQSNVNDTVRTIRSNKDWEFRFVGSAIEKEGGGYKSQFELIENRTGDDQNHTFTLPSTLLQFFKLYYQMNAPLAMFPLVTNQFNKSKSEISLIEATYAGSCYMGNRELAQFDLPFVVDISKGLYEPFTEICGNYSKMLRSNDQAWEWVTSERLLSKINLQRVERLLNI